MMSSHEGRSHLGQGYRTGKYTAPPAVALSGAEVNDRRGTTLVDVAFLRD